MRPALSRPLINIISIVFYIIILLGVILLTSHETKSAPQQRSDLRAIPVHDIERILQFGVHGPTDLIIFVVE